MRVSDNNSNWEATAFIYPLMSEVDQYFLAQPTARKPSLLVSKLMSKWTDLHTIIQSTCFLLNPCYLDLQPWRNEDVMTGFLELASKWQTSAEKSDIVEELNIYTSETKLFSEKIM